MLFINSLIYISSFHDTFKARKIDGSQCPIKLLRVSHCVVKSLIFQHGSSYRSIFLWLIEIVEQNFFNRADFYSGLNSLFLARLIFSGDDLSHTKSGNPI